MIDISIKDIEDIMKFIFYFVGTGLVISMILMADILRKIAIDKKRNKQNKANNINNLIRSLKK